MQGYFEVMVCHITKLAMTPGWLAYARDFAAELDAEKSGAYAGIVEAVRVRIAEEKAKK